MPEPKYQSLLARLALTVQRQPEHVALHEAGNAVSYAALWNRVALARDAIGPLLQPGEHVALVLDNGADYVAAVYGTWAAEGVVIGLNTSLKDDDLLSQIRHSQARVLVLTDKRLALAEAALAAGVRVLSPAELQAGHDATGPLPASAGLHTPADAAATLIYTSGTTGQPKGVVLSHGNLAANVLAVQHTLPIRADDIAICLLPFFYAYGCSVLHTHLTAGATLVLENSFMYPHKVLQRMAAMGATAFYGVPSSYYLLMERDHLQHTDLSRLRYCAQAGGAMDPARIAQFCTLLPHTDFYVMYGQTEACSRLSTLPAAMRAAKPGSVGTALPGVTLSIQDEQGRMLPPGETGEVCAQGPNVMQGYWQAHEDTARTLRAGWLLTGDLGYLDQDGYLYLTGRSREMIKTGAHRVSPLEIEQLINTVPGVSETAAIAVPDHLLGEVIRACVLTASPSDALRREILQACKARLAPYKIPKQVAFFEAFPRTASGKVQKHLLQPDRDDLNAHEH